MLDRIRFLILLSAATLLSGCVSSPVKLEDHSRHETFDEPQTGVATTRGVGDTLIKKGARKIVDAIQLVSSTTFNKAEGEASVMTCAVTAMAGTYPQRGVYLKEPRDAACFGPVTTQLTRSDGSTNWNCPGHALIVDICRDASGAYFIALAAVKAYLKQDFDHIRPTEQIADSADNLVQELIYTGRSGDRIGITYREFGTSVTKPAYVQEMTYDLAASREVSFRGARLEIVDADGQSISFRVLSTFAATPN